MTKYVSCRVIESRPQPSRPVVYAMVPRPSKPNPFKHYLANRYMGHERPCGGVPCQLNLLA